MAHLKNGRAAKRLVLANLRNIVGQLLLDGAPLGILSSTERFHVGTVLKHELRDVADEILENLVLRDEIRLGVHLDDRAVIAFDGDADETLGGRTAGLLGGRRQALGAQPVDRRFHLAVRLGKRLLAVHHAGAGALAQFLHTRGRDLSHVLLPLVPRGECRGPDFDMMLGSRLRRGTAYASSACSTGGSAISPMSWPRAAALPERPSLTACATASV